MIDANDRMAIHELLGLYGHIIDDRRWSDLELVFTQDSVFDHTDFGYPATESLDDLRDFWSSDDDLHPLAHHATNIVISEESDGRARVLSKGIGVARNGRVGSVVYNDLLIKTDEGWRIASRHAALRRA